MGTSLTGLTPATTYDALIKVGDNGPITASLKPLSDGLGNNLPMEASTSTINFTGTLQQSGTAVPTAAQVNAKQDTLVSGTNIKTINGTSILGSGNIVTPTTSPSGVSGAIQFSNGSAFASDAANLFWDDTNNRLGIGTNAPSATTHIKGSGSTSATTSLLVQNSGGTEWFKIRDDGQINISTTNGQTFVQGTTTFQAQTAAQNMVLFLGALTTGTFFRTTTNSTDYPLEANANGLTVRSFGSTAHNASAVLDVQSTTRGLLPPRMTTTQKNAISSPAAGLVVYDSTTNKLCCYNGSTWNDLF